MKIGLSSFGNLVRPRNLSHARLYPSSDLNFTESERWNITNIVDIFYRGPKDLLNLNKPLEEIFKNLTLGNTNVSLDNCYVGEITHFILSIGYRQHVIVDANNYKEIINKLKEKYKKNNIRNFSFRIQYVGIKIYKGIEETEKNNYTPINLWTEQSEYVWFYKPWDLISIKSVIEYENLNPGNLIVFTKTNAIVLETKTISKTKFYKTNSWSCKTVTILSGRSRKKRTFLPERRIKMIKIS